MTKFFYTVLGIVLVIVLGVWYLFVKNVGTVNVPGEAEQNTETPSVAGFTVPAGFNLNVFSTGVAGARVIEMDPKGRLVVSQPSEGKIMAIWDADDNKTSDENEKKVLVEGLKKPHGLAFNCADTTPGCFLYVAESDKLSRYPYDAENLMLGKAEKLMDISSSITDRHSTRSLLFLPARAGEDFQDTLLISVGSSCDVCKETDTDHATVLSYNTRTKTKAVYATGLRNATFMNLHPVSGKVFATEMGRDNLGDNLPPDEINIIEPDKNGKAKNYGWPICFGKNVHDIEFDKNTYVRTPCMEPYETPSYIDLQAHSAPLGLAFIPEEGWPEEYWYNMLVAYHGSWNRTEPTGYKIVRLKMNAKGVYSGTEDFITGWLTNAPGEKDPEKLGRPADIKILSGGVAYISDDNKGLIYRLARN